MHKSPVNERPLTERIDEFVNLTRHYDYALFFLLAIVILTGLAMTLGPQGTPESELQLYAPPSKEQIEILSRQLEQADRGVVLAAKEPK